MNSTEVNPKRLCEPDTPTYVQETLTDHVTFMAM